MGPVVLEMDNICKSFSGIKALDRVCLTVRAGEVHALLGENGAGKSTLIKILGGIYQADSGSIFIDGKPVHITNAHSGFQHGISIIHQELMILPEMTIAENIFLGKEVLKNPLFVDADSMNKAACRLMEDFGLDYPPVTKVKKLSIANQQMIEIIRAISFGARIIVMDEPTSSISDKEVDVLFRAIRKLTEKNIAIIYISHRMSELDQITDRITVLRDGQYIGTVETKSISRAQLISMMVGRELTNYYTKDTSGTGSIVLKVSNLNDGHMVKNVSFDLRKGEILGFAGLIGAGRSEAMECLFGLTRRKSGEILFQGSPVHIRNIRDAIRLGFGLVPENRKEEGLFPVRDISFNTTIEVLGSFIHGISVNSRKEKNIAEEYSGKMNVKASSLRQAVGKLSGGNQQKVMIARWLAARPQVLILDEPTRGIDVNAKAEIYYIINELAKNGMSIILISSELPELINMSDRIVVMNNGSVTGIIDSDFTQEKIMKLATTDVRDGE